MSASTLQLTAQNFDDTIANHDIVVVDWWAEWCGPCRMFGPIFEDAAVKHSDIVFGKVDTEAEQQLSAAAGIRSIPNLMVFREGVLLFNQPGALPAHALDDLIAQVRQIDMAEVHRQIAADRTAPPAG
jgi:thioredoxin 1